MRKFDVSGMSCAACAARVEKAMRALPDVRECSVSLLTNSMTVTGEASDESIVEAVRAAGYHAAPAQAPAAQTMTEASHDPTGAKRDQAILVARLVVSLVLVAVLMYLSMFGVMLGAPLPFGLAQQPLMIALCQLLLAGAVMIVNQKFFINGVRGLLHGAPNMDTLVSLGSAASFAYSTYLFFTMCDLSTATPETLHHALHGMYFESAAMIVALVTLGKLLEAHSKGKTTDALRSLMDLAPKTAVVVRDQAEVRLPVSQVVVGDVFIVRPGESIPVDGVILQGSAAVNEAALSGESIPVDKTEGDSVSAATTNQSGYLVCRAVRVGEDTTLSQIIRMVSEAAATKAPVAKLADRVSGIFVPVVLGIALLTVLGWLTVGGESVGFAMARGISVLVISCPCALGLATPVAIMVGNGVGAKRGILFKSAAALEMAGRIGLVALDKTGTITQGEPHVTDLQPADGIDEIELLTCAAALEQYSEHPLSRAILRRAHELALPIDEVTQFRALPGNGLEAVATIDGQSVRLCGGKQAYIEQQLGGAVEQRLLRVAETLEDQGKTALYFSRGSQLLGMIAVADVIKPDSARAVSLLRRMGLKVVMLTGDHPRTARAIAKQAGVDDVIAGVLPDGKEQVIRELQTQGKVAMVGDGINDAPALTRAELGIAIGAGTDVAIDAADVVLVNSSLIDAVTAIRLGRATLRNIRQNLFWAFFYNCIGIPLAAGVLIGTLGWELNPMIAAAAMSLSSVCVVTNALRLNRFRAPEASVPDDALPTLAAEASAITHTTKEKQSMSITIRISGMMCPHCSGRVREALEALEQVATAQVSHETGEAIVTPAEGYSDIREVCVNAITAAGYAVIG